MFETYVISYISTCLYFAYTGVSETFFSDVMNLQFTNRDWYQDRFSMFLQVFFKSSFAFLFLDQCKNVRHLQHLTWNGQAVIMHDIILSFLSNIGIFEVWKPPVKYLN